MTHNCPNLTGSILLAIFLIVIFYCYFLMKFSMVIFYDYFLLLFFMIVFYCNFLGSFSIFIFYCYCLLLFSIVCVYCLFQPLVVMMPMLPTKQRGRLHKPTWCHVQPAAGPSYQTVS